MERAGQNLASPAAILPVLAAAALVADAQLTFAQRVAAALDTAYGLPWGIADHD